MPDIQYVTNYNIGGLNQYINPLLHGFMDQQLAMDGELIRCVNLDSYPVGAKQKRPGYITLLDTADGSQVNTLFSWTQDSGTTTYLYRYSGTTLYYYLVGGTATAWQATNNTANFGGTHMGYSVLGNTMIVGDGVGSTCHTTNGTSFTNTTLAPIGEFFSQYHNRIYICGTNSPSTLFYSTRGDATNWNISGTSDSSSFTIPDAGRLGKTFVLSDNLVISKNSGKMFRWDDFNLFDMSVDLGPSSPYSYAAVEGMGFWLNRRGVFTSQGDGANIISNPIQREIYNDGTTGIAGTMFGTAPGVIHQYDYYLSVGSVQDDFTNEPLNKAVIKYNYQKNEFLNYQFNDQPTSFGTFTDANLNRQLMFGNTSGQVFQYGGTALTDNGVTVSAVMDMVFNFNQPHFDKDWRWIWCFFNPGCEAQIQVALVDTFSRLTKNWIDLGDVKSGVIKYRFPTGSRSKLLWFRIKESSQVTRFTFYGISIGAVFVDPG